MFSKRTLHNHSDVFIPSACPPPSAQTPITEGAAGHGSNGGGGGGGLDYASMYEDDVDRRSPDRAPSATVPPPPGRGPSQAADFFSAGGAPSILEVSKPPRLGTAPVVIVAPFASERLVAGPPPVFCRGKKKEVNLVDGM